MSNWSSDDGGGGAVEPPPAPPLPPQASSARAAANALARFAHNINYSAAASTTTQHPLRKSSAAGLVLPLRSRLEENFPFSKKSLLGLPPLGPPWKSPMVPPEVDKTPANRIRSPISSRSVSHKTGIPIFSLDISPCRTRAVLAGRDILKTLAVTGTSCAEDYNVREKTVAYAATRYSATLGTLVGLASAKQQDHLAANDVKWSHGDFHTTIATAAANGQIVIYDLNRADVELARLREHNRQVHRLGFNPHRGNLLLSGSQDATTRLWDLRALAGERSVMTCYSKSRYAGNSEGVRDLQWSPTNGVEFAIGTDSGVLQRWDIRKEFSPILKVNAHEQTCNSIDWHPDGQHLVSGSSDKRVKVWDFSSSDRRMKPLWQLRVPQAAVHVRWRPAGWSSDDHRPGHRHCTQLAVSYDKEDPHIHIWDLRRPSIPFRVMSRCEIPPTALLWHSEDLLWSVDSAGVFRQDDVRFAPMTIDGYNVNPISIAPDGQILFASMKRERRRLSIEDVTDSLLNIERRKTSKSGSASPGNISNPGSHEEPSLLNSSFKNRRTKAPNSLKSARSMDITPPSGGPSGEPDDTVLPLDQSLQPKHMYKNAQVMAMGNIPGLVDNDAYEFMARHYLAPPEVFVGDAGYNLHLVLGKTFMYNAGVAAFAGKHRLAQTWKILAHAVETELGERAEQNYQVRMAAAASEETQRQSSNTSAIRVAEDVTGNNKNAALEMGESAPESVVPLVSQTHSHLSTPPAGPAERSLAGVEAIDNMVILNQHLHAHPTDSTKGKQTNMRATEVLDPANIDSPNQNAFALLNDQTYTETNAHSPNREPSPDSGLIELDRQVAERRAAMGNYRAHPRPVLKLDDPFSGLAISELPKLKSEGSNESLQMFSASADSSHKARSTMDSFEYEKAMERPANTTHDGREILGSEKTYKRGQAESAVAFDDEVEMAAAQHSPASPKSNMSPTKGKYKTSLMPSSECGTGGKQVQAVFNYEDIHPLQKVTPPPQDKPATSNHKYIESDFFEKQYDVGDKPSFPPWTATAMFVPLVEYHCQSLFDAQLPAYLLLHLAPWLYVPIHWFRALGIISTYHQHLMQFELYKEATELRTYCETQYPSIAAFGGDGIDTGGPWCTNCHKISKGRQQKYCERCKKPWADCSVCHDYGPILGEHPTDKDTVGSPRATHSEAGDKIWGWCPRCGHGGHTGCLRAFWDSSEEGACPSLGCTCDCIPGKRRKAAFARLEEEWKKRKHGTVSKDSWTVKESSAVQRTRSMVSNAPARRSILQGGRGSGRGDGSGGPQPLGATGRSASGGKKSVRFAPSDDEEGENDLGKGKGRAIEKPNKSF